MRTTFAMALILFAAMPLPAHAYLGPGLDLGVVAIALGVVGSAFLALFAVIWYPIKRALGRLRSPPSEASKTDPA